jgi:hypothetical protein
MASPTETQSMLSPAGPWKRYRTRTVHSRIGVRFCPTSTVL